MQEAFKSRLRESIRQSEDLVRWHVGHDNLKIALEIASKITHKRELLRILESSTEGK